MKNIWLVWTAVCILGFFNNGNAQTAFDNLEWASNALTLASDDAKLLKSSALETCKKSSDPFCGYHVELQDNINNRLINAQKLIIEEIRTTRGNH